MEEQLRQSFDILCPSSSTQQAAAADCQQRPLRSRFRQRLSASVRSGMKRVLQAMQSGAFGMVGLL